MDGFRATRLIRAREKVTGSHVPIVALNANVVEGERQHCVAAERDDYPSKSMGGKELVSVIARLLHEPGLAATDQARSTPSLASPEQPNWLPVLRSMRIDDEAIRGPDQTFITTALERLAALQQAGQKKISHG